jgi:hypothetical protein
MSVDAVIVVSNNEFTTKNNPGARWGADEHRLQGKLSALNLVKANGSLVNRVCPLSVRLCKIRLKHNGAPCPEEERQYDKPKISPPVHAL